jgi:N-acetylmuramoyl-L-alanine amidase
MRIQLRNRLHHVDHIAGASVRILGANGVALVSGTTNAVGSVQLNITALPAGTYTCEIRAPHTFDGPVGPTLVSSGAVPERVYRSVDLTLVRTAAGITNATPTVAQHANVTIASGNLIVDVQPVWMRSTKSSSRGQPISMIIVHHTACALGPAVNTFLGEKGPHYMIDTDGQIVKWVQETRAAWHAGEARWSGHDDINARSIGIEIVHKTGDYPEAQYTALLDLLARLRTAFPAVDAWDIIGHSDVGTNGAGRLGRKSGDPGARFQWSRLERRGLGMSMLAGPPNIPAMYGGFFQTVPDGALRLNDNDARHRFDGVVRPTITGTPVQELQQDLASIGYSVGTPDGDFGQRSHYAVLAFQEHFFAGGRGHKTPDGRVDLQTAAMIKNVAGARLGSIVAGIVRGVVGSVLQAVGATVGTGP